MTSWLVPIVFCIVADGAEFVAVDEDAILGAAFFAFPRVVNC